MDNEKMTETPLISVIMGIYNCAGSLEEAVAGLFAQTCDRWELVMCDDGSTDDTWKVASALATRHPGRIVLLRHDRNRGLAAALNTCIAAARGPLLARQDADDVSLPERLQRQLDFLRAHPDCGWVGTAMIIFDGERERGARQCPPRPVARDLVRGSAFCHATVMIRAEAIARAGGYRETFYTRRTEDYDLWMRLYGAGLHGANLPDPLYRVREDADAYRRKRYRDRLHEAITRCVGYRAMRAPLAAYPYVLRPLLVGLAPAALRRWRQQRLAREVN